MVEKYAVGEDSESAKKNMVALNWLLTDKPLDLETELALGFLDNLLLGTPAAPLRKALMESGLGESIVGGGIEDELRQPQFSVGMKGVADENIRKVEDLIFSTFKKLVDEGFTEEAVEASINSVEFSLRENNTGSFPRGLSLMLRSMVSLIVSILVTAVKDSSVFIIPNLRSIQGSPLRYTVARENLTLIKRWMLERQIINPVGIFSRLHSQPRRLM